MHEGRGERARAGLGTRGRARTARCGPAAPGLGCRGGREAAQPLSSASDQPHLARPGAAAPGWEERPAYRVPRVGSKSSGCDRHPTPRPERGDHHHRRQAGGTGRSVEALMQVHQDLI